MFSSAALPNLAEPGVIAFGAALGAVVGGTIARALRYTSDNRMHWAVEGSYYGSGVALVVYLVVNLLGAVS
jgi:hypothetical protein